MLTWHASKAMLPLVVRIAQDIVHYHGQLQQLCSELASLEENRRELTWPQRARRYELEDEIATAEVALRAIMAELDSLGVTLLDSTEGLVGFPTMVNQRRAFFSWKPGEETIAWWNYVSDRLRRSVPEEWTEVPRESRSRRSRSRKK
jgi:hypothetical protein